MTAHLYDANYKSQATNMLHTHNTSFQHFALPFQGSLPKNFSAQQRLLCVENENLPQ